MFGTRGYGCAGINRNLIYQLRSFLKGTFKSYLLRDILIAGMRKNIISSKEQLPLLPNRKSSYKS